MLPAAHRLTDGDAFRVAVRNGRRHGTRRLVAHLQVLSEVSEGRASAPRADHASDRIGFVVSKAVGNAVVRNRVKRRLRHLTREHLADLARLPGSAVLVVRALPGAAGASYADLGADLERCLHKCIGQVSV